MSGDPALVSALPQATHRRDVAIAGHLQTQDADCVQVLNVGFQVAGVQYAALPTGQLIEHPLHGPTAWTLHEPPWATLRRSNGFAALHRLGTDRSTMAAAAKEYKRTIFVSPTGNGVREESRTRGRQVMRPRSNHSNHWMTLRRTFSVCVYKCTPSPTGNHRT
jgi:hypothetical protein